MAQSDMGDMESPLSGEEFINGKLEPWAEAVKTLHSGASAPSYILAGMMWINTATNPWVVNIFDGAQSVEIGTLNTTTHVFTPKQTAQNLAAISSSSLPRGICEARLTLSSGVPVTTANLSAQSTLYFTPYKGDRIELFDGTNWNVRTLTEISIALTGLVSGRPYDVFVYDNAGTPAAEVLAWTNDTTRATAIILLNGIAVKSGQTTRRYVGTFYTTGTNTTEDSATKRYVWNMHNRVERAFNFTIASNWTYATATPRQANGDANARFDYVCGLLEEPVEATLNVTVTATGIATPSGGIGLDSITTYTRQWATTIPANGYQGNGSCRYIGYPGLGRHFFSWLETGATGAGSQAAFSAFSGKCFA